jgi:hypothetical protein
MDDCYGCIMIGMMKDNNCFIIFEDRMYFINKPKCPCRECILKMICQTSCKEFLNPKGEHIGENYTKRTT